MYLAIEISQLLYKFSCTYDECDEIIQLVLDEVKQQREDFEYNTVNDYISGYKSRNAGDIIIKPLNHVSPYC